MDAIDAVKMAFGGAHMWFEGTAADVSAEQANQIPPGAPHPIGELMTHILLCEDFMLSMLRGEKTVWEQGGWGTKLDMPMMVELPEAGTPALKVDPAGLREYGKAVFAHTDAYLGSLRPADLEREADLTPAGMGKMPLGTFLLTMLLGNTYAHTGEISTIKGMQGARGYPF